MWPDCSRGCSSSRRRSCWPVLRCWSIRRPPGPAPAHRPRSNSPSTEPTPSSRARSPAVIAGPRVGCPGRAPLRGVARLQGRGVRRPGRLHIVRTRHLRTVRGRRQPLADLRDHGVRGQRRPTRRAPDIRSVQREPAGIGDRPRGARPRRLPRTGILRHGRTIRAHRRADRPDPADRRSCRPRPRRRRRGGPGRCSGVAARPDPPAGAPVDHEKPPFEPVRTEPVEQV